MKSLILKVTSMRKLTNLVCDVLLDFNNMVEINYIHKTKLSITLKYNWFEVLIDLRNP